MGESARIPKTIWFLLFQGLGNAPYVLRKCHESWVTKNPGWPHSVYKVGLLSPIPTSIRSEIDPREVPVYKTTWRVNGQAIPSGSILEYLLDS